MPKKSTVYTRNKDFIDDLRQQGKSWEDVAAALTEIGESCTKAGVHYAYKSYLQQKAKTLALAKESRDPEAKLSPKELHKRAKDEAEAARSAGNLSTSSAEQLRQWAVYLNHASPSLADLFLDTCKGQNFDFCLCEFERCLRVIGEISESGW